MPSTKTDSNETLRDRSLLDDAVRPKELPEDKDIDQYCQEDAHVVDNGDAGKLEEETGDVHSQDLGADERSHKAPLRWSKAGRRKISLQILSDDVDGCKSPSNGQGIRAGDQEGRRSRNAQRHGRLHILSYPVGA